MRQMTGAAGMTRVAVLARRPDGMHPQRHKRLLRELERRQQVLEALPGRRMAPHDRKRVATQLRNRSVRIRRALRLPVPHPPVRERYLLGEAARLIGVSTKTLSRWIRQGRVRYEQGPYCRVFARLELLRVIQTLKV